MYTVETFINDIPIDVARNAHYGTSFVPDQRAEQERQDHAQTLASVYAEVLALAGADREAEALEDLQVFRDRFKHKKLALLYKRSGLMSSMIAGPSNFPARQMNKKNESYDKAMREYLDWFAKATAALKKEYDAVVAANAPIRTGESDAIDRLAAKIAKAEKLQDIMRSVNAAMRKQAKNGADTQVAAMVEAGVTEAQARQLLQRDFAGRLGFADYQLTNNSANIRRMKEQLAKAQKLAASVTTENEINGVRIVDNVEDDRLQMFFPVERVARPIYDMLKSHGFRWTPSAGCFQAYRGGNANYYSRQIAEAFTV